MLSHLHIRDFAIVDRLDLEFEPGLTVLTGETGAGKSILVDALALALGGRAGANTLRPGAERTEVSALFELPPEDPAQAWLAAQELADDGGECLVRRTVSREGRSRAFVNGRPAPLQTLRDLGAMLVDIHGQHAHHALLKRDVQRQTLDAFGEHGDLLERLAGLHRRLRALDREAASLGGDPAARAAEQELLEFQVRELQELDLQPGELEALEEELSRLGNVDRLAAAAAAAHGAVAGDAGGAADDLVQQARRSLEALVDVDPRLGPVTALLENASIHLGEAAGELRRYREDLETDPGRLAQVEHRLDALHTLARKHRVEPAELPDLLARLQERLEGLAGGEARMAALQEERRAAAADYDAAALALRQRRRESGERLAAEVSANMHGLGMPNGAFQVAVQPLDEDQTTAHGRDQVEFLVTTNPGQPPAPLSRVASGGELSRISLAIQVIGTRDSGAPSVVFDEVDVGVGGGVAEMVGRQLRALAAERQVLCITHLPQVASQGMRHVQVSKEAQGEGTVTRILPLEGEQRVEEVARMLGGIHITDQTLAHAREMLGRGAAP